MPDQQLAATGSRDCRIDFFRGLALYMIFVDHVVGDPLSTITYRVVGFSDAAEIFVFLSGLVCGTVYARTLARDGLSSLFQATTRRVVRIYIYYVLSTAATVVLVAIVLKQNSGSLTTYFGAELIEQPLQAMGSALWLASLPPYSQLFVLYILLTLIVMPAFLVVHERYRLVALAISGVVWLGAQIFSDFLAPLSRHLALNPLAWQFLYVIGLFIATKRDFLRSLFTSHSQLSWAVKCAFTIVIVALCYRLVAARSGFNVAWMQIEPSALEAMKVNLSPIRIIHFLSVALLVAVYVRRDSFFLKWSISMPLVKAGMHSLQVFSLVVVLDNLINLIVLTREPDLYERLLLDAIAFLVLALFAIALPSTRQAIGKLRRFLVGYRHSR